MATNNPVGYVGRRQVTLPWLAPCTNISLASEAKESQSRLSSKLTPWDQLSDCPANLIVSMILEPMTGLEPVTPSLPWKCSTC